MSALGIFLRCAGVGLITFGLTSIMDGVHAITTGVGFGILILSLEQMVEK